MNSDSVSHTTGAILREGCSLLGKFPLKTTWQVTLHSPMLSTKRRTSGLLPMHLNSSDTKPQDSPASPDLLKLSCAADVGRKVQEYTLMQESEKATWHLSRDVVSIAHKKIFAPANVRAAADSHDYRQLVQHWLEHKYTLRYSGGMVPDVHHILAKVGRLGRLVFALTQQ